MLPHFQLLSFTVAQSTSCRKSLKIDLPYRLIIIVKMGAVCSCSSGKKGVAEKCLDDMHRVVTEFDVPKVSIDILKFTDEPELKGQYIILDRSKMEHMEAFRIKVEGPASIYIGHSIAVASLHATDTMDVKKSVPIEVIDGEDHDHDHARKLSVVLATEGMLVS